MKVQQDKIIGQLYNMFLEYEETVRNEAKIKKKKTRRAGKKNKSKKKKNKNETS